MQPQGMLPMQQNQMEEPLIHLDSRDPVLLPRCNPDNVKSLLENFRDSNHLTQALPRDKDLPLNVHHCPPIQEPKQY
jgi:hypothetical protein